MDHARLGRSQAEAAELPGNRQAGQAQLAGQPGVQARTVAGAGAQHGAQRAGGKLVGQDAAHGVPQGTLLLGEGEGVAGRQGKLLLTRDAAGPDALRYGVLQFLIGSAAATVTRLADKLILISGARRAAGMGSGHSAGQYRQCCQLLFRGLIVAWTGGRKTSTQGGRQ